jgi:uridine kinase
MNERQPVVVAYQVLADEILAAGSPRLIAVDGRAGAGKTTFTTRLRRFLPGAVVIEVDDFLDWSDLDNWWPRLENEALAPLLAGDPARFRTRDWNTDPLGKSLDGWCDLGPAQTIIVEGVTSSRVAIAHRLSMSFWVEAPRNVRMARGIARDGEAMTRFWQTWMQLEDEFFVRDDARGRATYLIAGEPAVLHDPEREVVVLVRPR